MKLKRFFAWILSLIIIILLWFYFAWKINSPLILPEPKTVLFRILELVKQKLFWNHFLFTSLRVLTAFVLSTVSGLLIGFVCGNVKFIKYSFEIPLVILRTIPVIAFILFVVYWFSSDIIPVFVCVMMTFPVMVSAVINGFEASNKKLMEMAQVFNLSSREKFRYIKIPAVKPYIKNGIFQTFGLSWKVVVAGEVLCLPKRGLGTFLQQSQMELETVDIIAATLILVLICFLMELLLKILFFKTGKVPVENV